MKEMIYGERKKQPEVLYSGEYRGHKFAILSLGSHPTAYIENKMDITDYDDCRLDSVSVHGGFTFCGNGYWGEETYKISWLGWDYGHYGDFMGYYSTDNSFYYQTKQWTTAEIYEEVKSVIEQIIKVEQYANSDEAKCIQAMLQDCREAYYNYSQSEKICRILYQKGYRKQSDTAREILKPLYDCIMEHSDCCVNLSEDIKFNMKKYGVEVEE